MSPPRQSGAKVPMIHSDSFKPNPIFYRSASDGKSERTYGIELEVDAGCDSFGCPAIEYYDCCDHARVLADTFFADGSAYLKEESALDAGFEIVSHPRTLRAWEDVAGMWGAALEYLSAEGYVCPDDSICRLHIHVDKVSVSKIHLYKIGKLFSENMDWLQQISRKPKEQFLRLFPSGGGDSDIINLMPLNTVEFRLFHSSMRWDKILGSIQIIDSLLDWVDQVSVTLVSVDNYISYVMRDAHGKKWGFAQEILCGRERAIKKVRTGWEILREHQAIARNPNTSPDVLAQLVKTDSSHIRSTVAANPNTPISVLVALASDNNGYVRSRVARNPNTPPDVLALLAEDDDLDVRQAAACNPFMPLAMLERLASADGVRVRDMAARNVTTPPTLLKRLACDIYNDVRIAVARNPNTPHDALELLASDGCKWVRRASACNPSTPAGALARLVADAEPEVRCAAERNLATPASAPAKLAVDKADVVRSDLTASERLGKVLLINQTNLAAVFSAAGQQKEGKT